MAAVPVASLPTKPKGYTVSPETWWQVVYDETSPELLWPLSLHVFDRMRRTDAQVMSVLRAVTLPIRRTRWWIEQGGASDEVAAHVSADLGLPIHGGDEPTGRTASRFSWSDHLRLALLMLPFGHMFFEQTVTVGDGGMVHLAKLGPRMPKTITTVNVADDGGLVSIEQMAGASKVEIPVDRLVAYVYEREGGNWLGTSLLRPAYKNWLLKERILRIQTLSLERNGLGVPLYQGAEGEEDLSTGAALAQAWRAGEDAGAAVPHGADLLLRGVEGRFPDADPAIRYHDEQIARAVLAHFLNLGTETGSWALGSTFADFFTLSLQALAQQIADVATQHVVEDLVDWNWGPSEPAPRVCFEEIGTRHEATAQALNLLTVAGILQPDRAMEETVREMYGLPSKQIVVPPAPPA